MKSFVSFQVIVLVIAFFGCESASILRTPKVYNALITTDQNLTPSRAYPVIQPSLGDSSFFYGPYGYPPYGYYDPFGFNPFESAQYVPKYNFDGTVNVNAAEDESVSRSAGGSKTEGAVINGAGSTEKPPIPLNEFGFPPSLIQLGPSKNPINLAPFGYNSYPLIYDQFSGYPNSAYLPHFGVLPQNAFAAFGPTASKVDDGKIGHGPIGANIGQGAVADGIAATAGPHEAVNEIGTPGVVGLDGNGVAATPQAAFSNDSPNPIYFDRENGVNQAGIAAPGPANVYGENGIANLNPNRNGGGDGIGRPLNGNGAFEAADQLGDFNNNNNGGFRTSASNNGAFGGVNGSGSRGFSSASNAPGGNNGGLYARGSDTSDARLRGTASNNSGGALTSNGGSSGQFNQENLRSSSSSTSSSRSQGQTSVSSSSSGTQQGGFSTSLQSNSKV